MIALSAAVAFGSTEAFTETTFSSTFVPTVSISVELLPNSWEFNDVIDEDEDGNGENDEDDKEYDNEDDDDPDKKHRKNCECCPGHSSVSVSVSASVSQKSPKSLQKVSQKSL